MNTAFGEPLIAVDTHIFRVANRTGLAPGKTPREVEEGLVAGTPPEFRKDAHHWLILHGRYVCIARTPKCPACIIRDLCEYKHKTPAAAKARTGRSIGRAIRRAARRPSGAARQRSVRVTRG